MELEIAIARARRRKYRDTMVVFQSASTHRNGAPYIRSPARQLERGDNPVAETFPRSSGLLCGHLERTPVRREGDPRQR